MRMYPTTVGVATFSSFDWVRDVSFGMIAGRIMDVKTVFSVFAKFSKAVFSDEIKEVLVIVLNHCILTWRATKIETFCDAGTPFGALSTKVLGRTEK
jgi:hypothetical protein